MQLLKPRQGHPAPPPSPRALCAQHFLQRRHRPCPRRPAARGTPAATRPPSPHTVLMNISASHTQFDIMHIRFYVLRPSAQRRYRPPAAERSFILRRARSVRRAPAPSCSRWQDPSLQQPGRPLPTRLQVVVGAQHTPGLGKQLITKRTVFTELQLASTGYARRDSPKTTRNKELCVPQVLPGKTRVPRRVSQLGWHN